jgi:hypothetical protein
MDPDAQAAARQAAADSLHVSIEEIRKIANSTFGDLKDDTQTEKQRFAKADVGHGPFTSYPMAQALATQHEAAFSVFTETIDGVLRDLDKFQNALLDSAKEYENTDDAAAAALAAVDSKFDSARGLDTQNAFDGARHDQGNALHTPESDDAATQPVDSAPAATEPGPTTNETVTTS